MTITAAQRIPVRAPWWPWLAWILVVLQPCSPARAESALPSLLAPLHLVAYSSGTKPPDFSGGTANSRDISTADLHGKVIVVNFWASWCLECRPEMRVLERLHRELAPQGLVVVGVNAREPAEAVRRFAREQGLTFPLVLDGDGKINARYGVVGLPTTFLVGRDGRAVAFAVGPREWAGAPARALIDALLAEPAPHPSPR